MSQTTATTTSMDVTTTTDATTSTIVATTTDVTTSTIEATTTDVTTSTIVATTTDVTTSTDLTTTTDATASTILTTTTDATASTDLTTTTDVATLANVTSSNVTMLNPTTYPTNVTLESSTGNFTNITDVTTDLFTNATTELTTTSVLIQTSTLRPTTTLSPCGYPPSVLNGFASRVSSSMTEFSCNSGFIMSGTQTLSCVGTDWSGSLPTCTVIDQRDQVQFTADWWHYFLAALLTFVALILLAFLLWCCCCSASSKVFPSGNGSTTRCFCCRRKFDLSSRSHNRGRLDLDSPQKYYHHRRGLIDMEEGPMFMPMPTHTRAPERIMSNSPRHITRSDGRLRFVQVVHEVVDDDKNQRPPWMPHSRPVRNINTSTK